MRYGEDIFIKMSPDYAKLKKFGFVKKGTSFLYFQNFLKDEYKAEIRVDSKGKVSGKVIELETDEEYLPIHIESYVGAYVGTIRAAYLAILKEIAEKCFIEHKFVSEQANRISDLIFEKYGEKSDNPFSKGDEAAVFRYPENQKWYALIMNIKESLLTKGKREDDSKNVDVINLKIDTSKSDEIHSLKGVFPAYHMNHLQWISITLNDSLNDDVIMDLINTSREYAIHSGKIYRNNNKMIASNWILPANPRFFDIEDAFNHYKEIDWKQSSKVKVGDIAYMYVGAPVSAVLYKCEITGVDIPYEYSDENIRITHVMRIKLLKKYSYDFCKFKKLNELGIMAVRGPRLATKEFLDYMNTPHSL